MTDSPHHDPLLDPVVDPVLEPVSDPGLAADDPAARPVADPGDVDPGIVHAVVDIRNRFGAGGLRDLVRLAQVELTAAERAFQELRDL